MCFASSVAVDKLKSVDDAFRRLLDSKEESHQRALAQLQQERKADIDAANRRVGIVIT
jgi:hypothetical protein